MSLKLQAHIATVAAFEALDLMAKKASVEPTVILDTILADPDGNTARYFNTLVQAALREVPAMLEKTSSRGEPT